jgi:hypothetical protein
MEGCMRDYVIRYFPLAERAVSPQALSDDLISSYYTEGLYDDLISSYYTEGCMEGCMEG